jgi:hypothetical protein
MTATTVDEITDLVMLRLKGDDCNTNDITGIWDDAKAKAEKIREKAKKIWKNRNNDNSDRNHPPVPVAKIHEQHPPIPVAQIPNHHPPGPVPPAPVPPGPVPEIVPDARIASEIEDMVVRKALSHIEYEIENIRRVVMHSYDTGSTPQLPPFDHVLKLFNNLAKVAYETKYDDLTLFIDTVGNTMHLLIDEMDCKDTVKRAKNYKDRDILANCYLRLGNIDKLVKLIGSSCNRIKKGLIE